MPLAFIPTGTVVPQPPQLFGSSKILDHRPCGKHGVITLATITKIKEQDEVRIIRSSTRACMIVPLLCTLLAVLAAQLIIRGSPAILIKRRTGAKQQTEDARSYWPITSLLHPHHSDTKINEAFCLCGVPELTSMYLLQANHRPNVESSL